MIAYNKVAIVVVVYGKSLEDSTTLQSLVQFDHSAEKILIVNNGPEILDFKNSDIIKKLDQKHNFIFCENHIENKPLSWIYNDFMAEINDVDYYILFDDDTNINKTYENYIFSLKDFDLELPKIFTEKTKEQHYPLFNGIVFQKDDFLNYSENNIHSIGSGLIISKRLKQIFSENNIEIFDSRFALYGVDISFFRKINRFFKEENLKISSRVMLNHSLSSTEERISEWRIQERLYDQVLSIKYYLSYPELRIIKLLFNKLLSGKFRHFLLVLKIYNSGVHPRCRIK